MVLRFTISTNGVKINKLTNLLLKRGFFYGYKAKE